jgi:hypothetical protein
LDNHSTELKELKQEKYFVMGLLEFDRKRLEEAKEKGTRFDINLVGALVISGDVTRELVEETFGKVRIFGIIRAAEPVKKLIRELHDLKN